MSKQPLPQEEFFIYVPLLPNADSLNLELDSEEESFHSSHEAWVKIPLAQQIVVYARICDKCEEELLIS